MDEPAALSDVYCDFHNNNKNNNKIYRKMHSPIHRTYTYILKRSCSSSGNKNRANKQNKKKRREILFKTSQNIIPCVFFFIQIEKTSHFSVCLEERENLRAGLKFVEFLQELILLHAFTFDCVPNILARIKYSITS